MSLNQRAGRAVGKAGVRPTGPQRSTPLNGPQRRPAAKPELSRPQQQSHQTHQTSRPSSALRRARIVSRDGGWASSEPGFEEDDAEPLGRRSRWSQEEDDGEGPLRPDLAEELRELERKYAAADRTQSNYRTRKDRIQRMAVLREALYGPRHQDSDVRLLIVRRGMAAEGRLRRRGRFAADDAMPRRSTWHKLAPEMQQRILDERAAALHDAVGLSRPAGRRLYVAAPALLCDITYGVAARLRALAARLGWTVEAAAAAVVFRPLLGELKLDTLEACAAEVALWQGGLPLQVVMERLVSEPSLAADGPVPLIARGRALCDALGLTPDAALRLLLRQPRLMGVGPGEVPARVAAARRVARMAARGARAPKTGAVGAVAVAATSGGGDGGPLGFPVNLLLCGEAQMGRCLAHLQQLLGLSPSAAASLLLAQPALALQPPAALRAAVTFLATRLPPPPPPEPEPLQLAAGVHELQSQPHGVMRSAPSPSKVVSQASAGGLQNPQEAKTLTSGGAASAPPVPQLRAEDALAALLPVLGLTPQGTGGRRTGLSGSSQSDRSGVRPTGATGTQDQSPGLPQRLPRPRVLPKVAAMAAPPAPAEVPPPYVQQLVTECPDVLLLQPRTAGASLDCLTRVVAEVVEVPRGDRGEAAVTAAAWARVRGPAKASHSSSLNSNRGGFPGKMWRVERRRSGRWEEALAVSSAARRQAAALVRAAPRLLLCRLLPPGSLSGGGGGDDSGVGGLRSEEQGPGSLGLVSAPTPEQLYESSKERQISLLAWAEAVDEAQRKRRIDSASVALDGPDWPAPILALPYRYEDAGPEEGDAHTAPRTRSPGAPRTRFRRQHPGTHQGGATGRDGGEEGSAKVTAAVAAASLVAAAAAVGAATVPIDLGAREAEMLQLFGLRRGRGAAAGLGGNQDRPTILATAVTADAGSGSDSDEDVDEDEDEGGSERGRAQWLRCWLWQRVFAAAPALLLLPSQRIAAAAEAVCTWMGLPAAALPQHLLPSSSSQLPTQEQTLSGTPAAHGAAATMLLPLPLPLPLPGSHMGLLTLRPELIHQSAYTVWNWLGGAAAATAADVAVLLRALPGLLYDEATQRVCGAVLHAALGGRFGTPGMGPGPGGAGLPPGLPPSQSQEADPDEPPVEPPGLWGQRAGIPDWVMMSPPEPPPGAPAAAAAASPGARTAPAVMPPEAAALLLLHPGKVLCEGVLRLMAPVAAPDGSPMAEQAEARQSGRETAAAAAEPAAVTRQGSGTASGRGGGGEGSGIGMTQADAPGAANGSTGDGGWARGHDGTTLLCAGTGRLAELLGVSGLAAAAMALATEGRAAELALGLPEAGVRGVAQAMAVVRRGGGTWRRELSRYLCGSTETSGGGFVYESLEAVSSSAWELLVVVREWRRGGRLAALEAAGMQDAVSFTWALQLSEEEWSELTQQVGLGSEGSWDHGSDRLR